MDENQQLEALRKIAEDYYINPPEDIDEVWNNLLLQPDPVQYRINKMAADDLKDSEGSDLDLFEDRNERVIYEDDPVDFIAALWYMDKYKIVTLEDMEYGDEKQFFREQFEKNLESLDQRKVFGVVDEKYTASQVREAVDIIIGDDGKRSEQVLEVLGLMKKGE